MPFGEHAVFVYGTLKPGGHYWPDFCEGRVARATPAKIRGQLYDLGVGYPGLLLRGEGWVQGYVLEFNEEADFLRLDYLEGYEPDRPYEENEYVRLRVACFSPGDEPLGDVWAYELTGPSFRRFNARLIRDGNWPV